MHLTERDVIEAFSKKRFLQLLLTTLQTFAMNPYYVKHLTLPRSFAVTRNVLPNWQQTQD